MRRIINSTYVSLDGVIKNPQNWPALQTPAGTADTGTDIQTELLLGADALLLGKDTFTSFASVWEGQSGGAYTDQMNSISKYVVSSTMEQPSWQNTTVISGDVAATVRRLKEAPGSDIVTYGIGRLARTLMEHDLLDEFRLWIHPFFIGTGDMDDLIFGQVPAARLDLVDTKVLGSGIAVLSYTVNRA